MHQRGRLAVLLLFTGILLILINSGSELLTGAVIGAQVKSAINLVLALSFVLIAVVSLLITEEGKKRTAYRPLEKRIGIGNTILQRRKDGYYIINSKTKEAYSLDEIRFFAKDQDTKSELRNHFFSDLVRGYAEAHSGERGEYRMFIEALSPNTERSRLERRLKQFENVYAIIKENAKNSDPKRVDRARPSDFGLKQYVRFENERDTLWPEEKAIGFLPFDEIKINPRRGPLFSVIEVEKLVKDGYLLKDLRLNPEWSRQKRQDYLSGNYGIDVGVGERTMIFFQLEKDARLEKFGQYYNVVVKNKVPLVRVNKKK